MLEDAARIAEIFGEAKPDTVVISSPRPGVALFAGKSARLYRFDCSPGTFKASWRGRAREGGAAFPRRLDELRLRRPHRKLPFGERIVPIYPIPLYCGHQGKQLSDAAFLCASVEP